MAFIFNQKFFKDLLEETRIDLENIVYYKDDTHYFVMTAKKASLIEKGVIKQVRYFNSWKTSNIVEDLDPFIHIVALFTLTKIIF